MPIHTRYITILMSIILLFFLSLGAGVFFDIQPNRFPSLGSEWYFANSGSSGHMGHDVIYHDLSNSVKFIKKCKIIISGNSRSQFGLDWEVLERQLGTGNVYNLSCAYNEKADFFMDVVRKYGLRPELVILNADNWYFSGGLSPAAQRTETQPSWKRTLFVLYSTAGFRVRSFLDNVAGQFGLTLFDEYFEILLYRSLKNGAWDSRYYFNHPETFYPFDNIEKAEDHGVELAAARKVVKELQSLGARVILTVVPHPEWHPRFVQLLARELGVPAIVVPIRDVELRDGEHLTGGSAKRFTNMLISEMKSCGIIQ